MADCCPAEITIGGVLKFEDREAFLQELEQDGLAYDYDGEPVDSIEEMLKQLGPDGTIKLYNNDVVGGQFDNVEQFCQEHGLAYIRHNDGHPNWPAEYSAYLPGWDEPRTYASTDQGGTTLTPDTAFHMYEAFSEVLNKLSEEAERDSTITVASTLARMKTLVDELRDELIMPTLPPLTAEAPPCAD